MPFAVSGFFLYLRGGHGVWNVPCGALNPQLLAEGPSHSTRHPGRQRSLQAEELHREHIQVSKLAHSQTCWQVSIHVHTHTHILCALEHTCTRLLILLEMPRLFILLGLCVLRICLFDYVYGLATKCFLCSMHHLFVCMNRACVGLPPQNHMTLEHRVASEVRRRTPASVPSTLTLPSSAPVTKPVVMATAQTNGHHANGHSANGHHSNGVEPAAKKARVC